MTLLLRALGGSRLYGTATEESDWDWYEIHDKIRTRQRKTGGTDTIKIGLSQWLMLANKGTHQALDAMWCPAELVEVDLLRSMRWGFRPDPWKTYDQLMRTAQALEDVRESEKRTKHATRLRFCAQRVLSFGWYDPTEWGRIVASNPQIYGI